MSKTKFPHPSAPTIAKASGSRVVADANDNAGMAGRDRASQSPPPTRKRYSGKEPKRQGPNKAPVSGDEHSDGEPQELPGSFPAKPRGSKSGRRAPGRRDPELGVHSTTPDADIGFSLGGGIAGPRQVYCLCRRTSIPGEEMLACTDCQECFHVSCIGVANGVNRATSPPYVCDTCLKQHPRKRRAPGTILGVGSKIAPLPTSKKPKKTSLPDVSPACRSSSVPMEAGDPSPQVESAVLVDTAKTAALLLASQSEAGGAMDDDDICPICEDECTCRAGQNGAGSSVGVNEGALMPLFSQISRHSASDANESKAHVVSASAAAKRGAGPAKKTVEKPGVRVTKAKTPKPAKPRAKKGKNSEKSLISRLVNAMDGTSLPATGADGSHASGEAEGNEDELLFADGADDHVPSSYSSDEDINDAMFIAVDQLNNDDSRWIVDDKPAERQSPLVAVEPTPATLSHRAKTTWHVQPGVTSTTKPPAQAKAKPAKRGRPPRSATDSLVQPAITAASDALPGCKKKKNTKKGAGSTRVIAADVEPSIFEVDAAVIRGRNRYASTRRGASPISLGAADDDDELINITDVTSDTSTGYPSETEFDLPSSRKRALARRGAWSDPNIPRDDDDDDDEDIEQEEEAYLARMRESGFSSSSLSDLDDGRLAVIRSANRGPDSDSGDESDSESCDADGVSRRSRRTLRKHRQRLRQLYGRSGNVSSVFYNGSSDDDSIACIESLDSNGSESESDQELTFRKPQTEEERALAKYAESGDEREDALLEMHLEQLRAVRSVIQDCSSPLLDHTVSCSDVSSECEHEITFTYRSGSDGSNDDLSDDLMEGWGTDVRKRWEADEDSSSDSSSLSESKVARLRLKDADDDEHSDLYSSDSYDEFYTRRAFMDMDSDGAGDAYDEGMYASGLDLDSASLALGVALSMEQQGFSKEDAAAAAAVAAAVYPSSSADVGAGSSDSGMLGKQALTTTITASMNANGEADPIDGIVSIKSSNGGSSGSRMATGAHTPFAASGWRAVAAAAAAAAYFDGSISPAISYVLPKDLNEARSPNIALAAAAAAAAAAEAETESSDRGDVPAVVGMTVFDDSSMSICSAARSAFSTPARQSAELPDVNEATDIVPASIASSAQPASSSGGFLSAQLPNSSFYKPLSSICLPARRASSSNAAALTAPARSMNPSHVLDELPDTASTAVGAIEENNGAEVSGGSVDDTNVLLFPGTPAISLAEVNAALNALVEQGSSNLSTGQLDGMWNINDIMTAESTGGLLKRKLTDVGVDIAGQPGDGADEKRLRGALASNDSSVHSSLHKPALDFGSLLDSGSVDLAAHAMGHSTRLGTPQRAATNPTTAMGAGTPMRGTPLRTARGVNDGTSDDDSDDWLLTMDQLVDTEALLIKSPPSTPVDSSTAVGVGFDFSQHQHLVPNGGSSGQSSTTAGGTDLFARWDRIPVNIFRRSRALASNHHRSIGSQSDMMGTMSSLALTAIKSSRQRRALINSTLLTQHTLPSEASQQQLAARLALRNMSSGSNSHRMMRQSEVLAASQYSHLQHVPPPPPPTPLSSRSNTMAGRAGSSNDDAPQAARVESSRKHHGQSPAYEGSGVEVGAPWGLPSQAFDLSGTSPGPAEMSRGAYSGGLAATRAGATKQRAAGARIVSGSGAGGSEGIYAFDWLEESEDLALFSIPELSAGDSQPSMTMMLTSASPMLMPYSAAGMQTTSAVANSGDARPEPRQQ